MPDWQIVLLKIATMFLVILVGWVLRRKEYLTGEVAKALSLLVVDVTLPALVLSETLRTVDRESLREGWYLPVAGAGIILVSQLVGRATAPLFSQRQRRNTFVLTVAIPNWFYMSVPIIRTLYGGEGMRALLLYNIGMHVMLWSLGVWTVRGSGLDSASLRKLCRNPGLIATAFGIVAVVLFPAANRVAALELSSAHPAEAVASVFYQAVRTLGSLTVPLSFLVIGAQLAGTDLAERRPTRAVWGAVAGRLVFAPLGVVLLVLLARTAGLEMDATPRMVGYLLACMPVAVTCGVFAERFGGDTLLASRAVFYSTLVSIVTVPALFFMIGFLRL